MFHHKAESILVLVFCLSLASACGSGGKVAAVPGIVDDVLPDAATDSVRVDGAGDSAVDGGWDTGGTDFTAPDAVAPCKSSPYGAGCPCSSNNDCAGGYCVESSFGYVCTEECIEECAEGWECKGMSGFGADLVFLCVPLSKELCVECSSDEHCGEGICVDIDGELMCSLSCDGSAPCPPNFDCLERDHLGKPALTCVPAGGSCDCTGSNSGDTRPCQVDNEHGSCSGFELCDPAVGFSGCTASTPGIEECDAMDNDCDGEIDEGLEQSMPCDNSVEGVGTCSGFAVCEGHKGWVCKAGVPALETCDFLDDDCDGQTDEDFKTGDKYTDQNHCGTCNHDCTGLIADAKAVCDGQFPVPQCVVESCNPGFFQVNQFQCLPEGQTMCKPCSDQMQCEGGACISMMGGEFCSTPCQAGEDCPESFDCAGVVDVDGQWCVPASGTCDCFGALEGATRPCFVENEVAACYGYETCDPQSGWVNCTAGDASDEVCDGLDNDCNGVPDDGLGSGEACEVTGDDMGTCTGVNVCKGLAGWACSAATPELEKCDYVDNDCDGKADEDFITGGNYAGLHHCGGCGQSCEGAMPNAVAFCDATSGQPSCKVQECLPGYYQLNDVQCIIPPDVACNQCVFDGDCFNGACVVVGEGKFCLMPCDEDDGCDAGWVCQKYEAIGDLCIPESGSCDCTGEKAGDTQGCSVTNEFGTCFGVRTCVPPAGWSECDATAAVAEVCDGIDNDCDGLADEGLPESKPCQNENEFGLCKGVSICLAEEGWRCMAPKPIAETCNFKDDNCNGLTDEDFMTGAKYTHQAHCGTCNNSCDGAVDNGLAVCDSSYLVPKCVVDQCDEGFIQISQFQCVEPPDTTCQPCGDDLDCLGGFCIDIDGQERCSSPCPDGVCEGENTCLEYPGLGPQCLPVSGSCDCNSLTDGTKRTCQVANDLGVCYGTETCHPVDGWSQCSALPAQAEECDGKDNDCNGLSDDGLPPTQPCMLKTEWGECSGLAVCLGIQGWVCQAVGAMPEVCDGVDNNCDGHVDEGFADENGLYSSLEYCGDCTTSCLEGFPNAKTTVCDLSGAVPDCKVTACADGYFKLDDQQCVPGQTGLCEACQTDDDCPNDGGLCIDDGQSKYCSRTCAEQSDCPSGYLCQSYDEESVCVPESGSCQCTETSLGMFVGCTVTWEQGDPYDCFGYKQCTAQGWSDCLLPLEKCDGADNNCDGIVDESFLVDGKYISDEHCGECGTSCKGLFALNAHGECNTALAQPKCVMACDEGAADSDGNPANGCECVMTGEMDEPDPDGVDSDCDGVDGEVDNAIFVATYGSDNSPGTLEEPKATVSGGIQGALDAGRTDVYVSVGSYFGSVSLQPGIRLFGGYSSDFKKRNPGAYETRIVAGPPTDDKPGAVSALGIDGEASTTVLDGFAVVGPLIVSPGKSSYAVYVADSTDAVRISGNRITAGSAGDGKEGTDGKAGTPGQDGLAGAASYEYPGSDCLAGFQSAGGSGGANTCGETVVSGGQGGDGWCPVYEDVPAGGEVGLAGEGASPGEGGAAGYDGKLHHASCKMCKLPVQGMPTDGANGKSGSAGGPGSGGPGCSLSLGTVVDGHWVGMTGDAGSPGTPGSGAGGGGAGGGGDSDIWKCNDLVGGTGGGGGAGGCGGKPGLAGGSGGGSFGVFIYFSQPLASAPIVLDNTIEGGKGGKGGQGGSGGSGGDGGFGGLGGPGGAGDALCSFPGGDGGDGGDGGHGGGGGGGCGGVSYCIYVWGQGDLNLSSYKAGTNTCFPGPPGPGGMGGLSYGQSGQSGTSGMIGFTNF